MLGIHCKIAPLAWFLKTGNCDDSPEAKNLKRFQGRVKRNHYRKKDSCRLNEMKFIVLDLETTGLKPSAGDEIISVGACVVEYAKILPVRFNRLVNPYRPIPRLITNLTGISNEMVAMADNFPVVIANFLDFLGDNIIIGHAIDFDIHFLNCKLKPYNLKMNHFHIDTALISRILNPECKVHSLDSILARMGISPEGRHTAEGDAFFTAIVFLQFLDRLKDFNINTFYDLRAFISNALLYNF